MTTATQAISPWLVCLRQNTEARLRLFLFPYAGGRASIFRTWPEELPSDVEVYAIDPPGRGTRMRESLFTRLHPMVNAVAKSIEPHLDKPFSFFGHSMGARAAFELTRKLRREGGPQPQHLFVSGCPAPQTEDRDAPVYNLPDAEFIEKLRRLNGTPREILEHPELLQLMLPILRADFELVQTYQYHPESPLDCPITAFGGLRDEEVSREELEAWHLQSTAGFVLRMFPGDHFFLHTSQSLLLRIFSHDLVTF